jgi:hypothetical protein
MWFVNIIVEMAYKIVQLRVQTIQFEDFNPSPFFALLSVDIEIWK